MRTGLRGALWCLLALASIPGWAGEVHIVHCLKGCPAGTDTKNDLVIREIYALSSNHKRKFADWVAYRVSTETIGLASSLDRSWKPDPDLEPEESLEEKDYADAYRKYEYEKGHLAPLASFAGTVFWRSTNILSNIAPQKTALNQGPWKKLEAAVRHAVHHSGQVFVLAGPLYDGAPMNPLPRTRKVHEVPTDYWKVVSTKSGRMTAFIMDQQASRGKDHCSYRVALGEVETRSGLELFPQTIDWPRAGLDEELGC